eukprot:scaffold2936_cov113-Cylindrotheca_fusiformis.AAC.3
MIGSSCYFFLFIPMIAQQQFHQVAGFLPLNYPPTGKRTISTSLCMVKGNYNERMSRYGRGPSEEDHQEQQQSELTWDWDDDDEDPNNDDMFAEHHQQQQQQPQPQQEQVDTTEGSEDELPSQDIQGAEFTEDMKYRAQAAHNDVREEASQGGSKFRELIMRAKQTADRAIQPPQQQSSVPIPTNPMDLSIEEQANLFRQLMMERQQQQQQAQQSYTQQGYDQQQQANYQQQQQNQPVSSDPNAPEMTNYQQQQGAPPTDPYSQPGMTSYGQQPQQQQQQAQQGPPKVYPPPPPAARPLQQGPPQTYREYGTGYDGRKIGRNKDADIVSNSADAYFAQLKRDSTSRNYARYAGDDVTANTVFHDPAIFEIEAPTNPYLEEKRERERNLVETVPEEMLLFQEYGEEQQERPQPMSYRDRLAQRQQQQQERQQRGEQ